MLPVRKVPSEAMQNPVAYEERKCKDVPLCQPPARRVPHPTSASVIRTTVSHDVDVVTWPRDSHSRRTHIREAVVEGIMLEHMLHRVLHFESQARGMDSKKKCKDVYKLPRTLQCAKASANLLPCSKRKRTCLGCHPCWFRKYATM